MDSLGREPAGDVTELISPAISVVSRDEGSSSSSWRINVSSLQLPKRRSQEEQTLVSRVFSASMGKKSRITKYYNKQEKLLKDFTEMESFNELGCLEGAPTEIAAYTMSSWAKTVLENVWSLVGRTAPPEFLAKLTYLIWNHHESINHIDTVRAYTLGPHYFVEVDIVLPGNMLLSQAHDIGETLQEKLELLPQVERAFVHVDFEVSHRPEHNNSTKL